MIKKIVLFASLCLFALSLSAASAEVLPGEYQTKGKDILIMPKKSIPVPAEY